jgi:protein O-mannosyl-transferase
MASVTESQLQGAASRATGAGFEPVWEKRGCLEVGLACIAILTFVCTLSFSFVYDDRGQILGNPFLRSWRYLRHDFTAHLWAQASNMAMLYYRPVFLSWLRLNYSVFGDQPWGWHMTTVVLHALATVLVFRLSLRVLRDRWQALIAGLIFAVHPVHVESVAWVSGVVDPLLAIFFLASLLCYFHWRERGSIPWLAGSVLCAVFAMLTKETGITLPAVVFAYAWIFADGSKSAPGARLRVAATHAAPFALVALVYWIARHAALPAPLPAFSSSATALFTLPGLLLFYLRLVVWPFGLGLFYDRQLVQHPAPGDVFLPALLLILLAAALVILLRRSGQHREGAFSAALALLVLAPVLWVRWFNTYDFVHDRYLYLPMAGFAMLFAIAISKLGGKTLSARPAPQWVAPPVQMLTMGAVTLAMIAGSVGLEGCWTDDLLLWFHCYKTAPHNKVVLNNLGASLGEKNELQSSLALLTEAVGQDPNYDSAQGNLGYTLYRLGQLQPAEEHLARAVQLRPGDVHSLLYLGLVHYKQGALDKAEAELRRAIFLNSRVWGVHVALSLVLEQRGDLAGAIRETETELTFHPDEANFKDRLTELRGRK